MKATTTLLPLCRVSFYVGETRHDKAFGSTAGSLLAAQVNAAKWVMTFEKSLRGVNRLYLNKVNGVWRSDWKLTDKGTVQPHPWAKNQ